VTEGRAAGERGGDPQRRGGDTREREGPGIQKEPGDVLAAAAHDWRRVREHGSMTWMPPDRGARAILWG
jgi:hypothetical protein